MMLAQSGMYAECNFFMMSALEVMTAHEARSEGRQSLPAGSSPAAAGQR